MLEAWSTNGEAWEKKEEKPSKKEKNVLRKNTGEGARTQGPRGPRMQEVGKNTCPRVRPTSAYVTPTFRSFGTILFFFF